jgi:protein-S-isoprenylcysteine O-methyltransferase Ste14
VKEGAIDDAHRVAREDGRVRRALAAVGTSVFLVLAPGVVAGLVPWWITRWQIGDRYWPPVRGLGLVLIAAGAIALLHSFLRFVVEGVGTPAPVAPTERLVVGGLYRYVRNPMYVAVLSVIVGQSLHLCRPALLAYAAIVAAAFVAFVRLYEEPTLAERFGDDYEAYRREVPAWRPRLHPWVGP